MSSVATSPVARLTQSSEHALHVQSEICAGWLIHGSYDGGSCSDSAKRAPLNGAILLVPVVGAISRKGQADLVALVHDDVPLVGPRLCIVVGDRLSDARSNHKTHAASGAARICSPSWLR